MLRWIPYTFVRTVMCFMGGITIAFYWPWLLPEMLIVGLIIFMAIAYFVVVRSRRYGRRIVNPGWIALPLILLLGYLHFHYKTQSRHPDHIIHIGEPIMAYRAIVTRFPEEKERSWKAEASVTAIRSSQWKRARGNIILYVPKQDLADPIQYGDVLLVRGHPELPPVPSNPGEFDYRRYLRLKNIYHQHFVKKHGVVRIGHSPPNVFMDIAYRGRAWSEQTLKRFVDGTREEALAAALVLGVTDGLDNELLDAYSATGSMHILAVSGLHISIIYFILLWMLSPLSKRRRGRWAVAVVSLAILWLYAFVTGLTPSVLRAVAMFSFFAIAKPWSRSTNSFNTLAVSAFCLLVFDPFLLFSVGFQLSYLAVLGILYIYPRIVRLWEPASWLMVEVWKLAAVSIAAQIATFPLGLLYFHQFPNYFLLSNLLVVPLSFVVLVTGLAVITTSFITFLASLLGGCLQWVIRFLNTIVFTLEDLPLSVTEDIHVNEWQCVLLLMLIAVVLALFESRRFFHIPVCFSIVMVFAALQWRHFLVDVDVRKLIVYNIPGRSAIDLMDRGKAWFLADSDAGAGRDWIRYHVTPNRIISGVRSVETNIRKYRFEGGTLVVWRGNRILRLDGSRFTVPRHLAVDVLVIGNNAVGNISDIGGIAFRTVVLDSSNTFFFASRFLEAAKLHKLDVHSVLHHGAFTSHLENRDS